MIGRLRGRFAESQSAPGEPIDEHALELSLEEFGEADHVVRVRSSVLGDDVSIASHARAAKRAPDQIVYLASELRHLYTSGRLRVDALQLLHRLKRAFPTARLTGTHGHRRSA